MRQLDGMAHRHLQNAGADLDLLRHRGDDAHYHDRIEGGAATAERVGDPQTGEALGLDLPREIGDPVERAPLHLGLGPQNVDYMHSHRTGLPQARGLIHCSCRTLAEPAANVVCVTVGCWGLPCLAMCSREGYGRAGALRSTTAIT